MIRQLVRMGHKLYATEGTAALIERNGMPVQMVTKRIGRGHPDMLDVILERTVDCVINTPGPADKEILDGIEIRRAAVERGVPCMTSIDTARTIVDGDGEIGCRLYGPAVSGVPYDGDRVLRPFRRAKRHGLDKRALLIAAERLGRDGESRE